jgi:Domain of unknown function (DUF4303)
MDRQFFAPFHEAAVAGVGATFDRVVSNRAPERVCGFCIYSDDDAQSICTISCTRESLQDRRNFFYTGGWPYDSEGIAGLHTASVELGRCYSEFKRRYEALYTTDSDRYWLLWQQYRMGVFDTLVSAMQVVAEADGFGTPAARDQLFVYFDITDSEVDATRFQEWARRLNTPRMYGEFLKGQESEIIRDWDSWRRS